MEPRNHAQDRAECSTNKLSLTQRAGVRTVRHASALLAGHQPQPFLPLDSGVHVVCNVAGEGGRCSGSTEAIEACSHGRFTG